MASEKAPATTMTPPVPYSRLKQIAYDACKTALEKADHYDHAKTETWNTNIINSILRSLISETTPSPSTPPTYKYAVNSTIIQHLIPSAVSRASPPTDSKPPATATPAEQSASASASVSDGDAVKGDGAPSASQQTVSKGVGRRGMHSATGAYWNNEKDGMWSFKYEEAAGRGMDVVVSIIWIAVA
ncbi:hypothetical protein GP486_008422 [Trichoglossum hirsutum]|uniref:Dynein light chain n=1 Tax=Trichoglossum hirsutum TaxID=265104 RepID=A0A9P8I9I5_9PEZI|nr:hypothetical protein GP486_008422 [Trichoglossum hirsutum]